jgi:ubiquinone/menaquinone biosynthesis C-methylase UbiE
VTNAAQLHQDQIAYWNSTGGAKWIAAQERTDLMLAPVSAALMAHAAPKPGMTVLDIGCGCGATVLALAEIVGPAGKVIGLDVSEPMLTWARKRFATLKNVELVCADASAYSFAGSADLMVSRFGVMFFGDPVAAFVNLRQALKPGGRLAFACWRKFDENPWMQIPLHAAYEAGVPRLPRPGPEDPGPFSFADQSRVTRILTAAGFSQPRFTPLDLQLDIAAGRGLADAVEQSLNIGATSRALQDQPQDLRSAATEAIAKALSPYAVGNKVELPAAIWLVDSAVPDA